LGLTISSSWRNGNATIWRGLCRALSRGGTRIFSSATSVIILRIGIFTNYRGGQLELYQSLETILSRAERQLADAEVALVGRAFV